MNAEGAPYGAPSKEIQLLRELLGRNNVNDLATLALTELHAAIGESEQCVVLANAHVLAWVSTGTALADDDGSGADDSSVKHLHTKSLCI